jgi:penicillin-binding protein 1C
MGREAAAPILFAVFDQLPMRQQSLPPAPEGALLATNAELPAVLRCFDARPVLLRLAASGGKDGPEIAFPVDGSTVALMHRGQVLKSLPQAQRRGRAPLA